MKRLLLLFLPVLFIASSCDTKEVSGDDNPSVDFDRKAMLSGWIDNVIVPAYVDNDASFAELLTTVRDFTGDPTAENRELAQVAFRNAYLDFQAVDPFLINNAEVNRLREKLNTYPADVALIEANLLEWETVNLSLPSNDDAQGFPALDYLLFEVSIDAFSGDQANGYQNYAKLLVAEIAELNTLGSSEWESGIGRQEFIDNDGSSATASIDRTVNDFIFHYEKFLRAGKVGIPAGVFSDDPLANRAEALYSGLSQELFAASLAASKDFFVNHGLADYLDAMDVSRNGELLSSSIENQYNAIATKANTIDQAYNLQVETGNVQMLELFDEMQKLTVLLKVDMLQALSINVDYVDADGD